jgi:hypothetical protein
MRLRIENKTGEAVFHRFSGQSLSGAGMHDWEHDPRFEGWLAGYVERGALYIPTKAQLRRCEPECDLRGYDNPEGEEEPREETAAEPSVESAPKKRR